MFGIALSAAAFLNVLRMPVMVEVGFNNGASVCTMELLFEFLLNSKAFVYGPLLDSSQTVMLLEM